jgi:hypothetical protein
MVAVLLWIPLPVLAKPSQTPLAIDIDPEQMAEHMAIYHVSNCVIPDNLESLDFKTYDLRFQSEEDEVREEKRLRQEEGQVSKNWNPASARIEISWKSIMSMLSCPPVEARGTV